MLEHLREAEALAERLKDDRRRGQVCAFMTTVHVDARRAGRGTRDRHPRAGDRRAPRGLEASHRRHELSRAGVLLSGRIRARGRVRHRQSRGAARRLGPRVFRYGRAGIGLRSRLADHEPRRARQIRRGGQVRRRRRSRLAEPTQHAHTIGWAHFAASMLHLVKGDWAKARSRVEHWIAMLRTGNVAMLLPWAVAASAWALAQIGEASEALNRVREGEQLLEQSGGEGNRRPSRLGLRRGGSRLSAARPARRGAAPGRSLGRILSAPARLRGPCAAPARRHRDPSRPVRCRKRRGPLPGGAGARRAARHAPARRPLPPRPGQALPPHGETEHAREHLTTATTMYREMDMGFWLEQAGR